MTPETLTDLIDATWPARSVDDVDGWTIRTGAGGGSRVSAATATRNAGDIEAAERAMRDRDQTPLFMVRRGEETLDRALEDRGYLIKDPVTVYTAPVAAIATERPPPVTCFQVWPPLATQAEIWDAGGVDDARLAVMHRACFPKTTVLGRLRDTPAGTAFAALHDGNAMLHAIETAHAFRRQGLARHMIRALAFWAQEKGAHDVALLVTQANVAANALYASMHFTAVEGYHYRIHPEGKT